MLCYDFFDFLGYSESDIPALLQISWQQIHITRLLQPGYHILYGQIWPAIYTVIVQDSASSEMRESTWDISISLILAPFQACHRLHLLLMLRCQRNQHRPPNNLLRKARGFSSNPAGLQYSYATRNTCPITLVLQLIFEQQNLC